MPRYQIDNAACPINWEEKDPIQRTIQNAKNLLMCRMGEVPFDRYRGFDPALFELPMEQLREELLPELDRAMMWAPDVEVVEAEAALLKNGETYIRVTIEVTWLN